MKSWPRVARCLASSIKVHLVHDNVTEELSLEDYVLGVMRAEGTTETEPEALKSSGDFQSAPLL